VLRGVDSDEAPALGAARLDLAAAQPVVTEAARAENDASELPADHPHWVKDAVAISRAARAFVARLRPIAIRVLTVWDHHFRAIAVAGQRVSVDASGSYRI